MPSYNEFTSSLFTMEPTAPAAALAPRPVTHQGAQHPLAEAQPGERSASAEATIDLDSLNPAQRKAGLDYFYVNEEIKNKVKSAKILNDIY